MSAVCPLSSLTTPDAVMRGIHLKWKYVVPLRFANTSSIAMVPSVIRENNWDKPKWDKPLTVSSFKRLF
jgi:hypothetical protein